MLTISKPLSSGQAQTYHAKEFTSTEQNYWQQGDTILGEWQGKMAERYGLAGAIDGQHFARLSEGQNPATGEQLVRHCTGQPYRTADGKTVKPVEHRAGWDATFSAPKSVSLTALVGGDERIREAHRQAVTSALTELERYTQARIGGNNSPETTGKFGSLAQFVGCGKGGGGCRLGKRCAFPTFRTSPDCCLLVLNLSIARVTRLGVNIDKRLSMIRLQSRAHERLLPCPTGGSDNDGQWGLGSGLRGWA